MPDYCPHCGAEIKRGADESAALQAAAEELSNGRDFGVIFLYHRGVPLKKIAKAFGVSYGRIVQVFNRANEKYGKTCGFFYWSREKTPRIGAYYDEFGKKWRRGDGGPFGTDFYSFDDNVPGDGLEGLITSKGFQFKPFTLEGEV